MDGLETRIAEGNHISFGTLNACKGSRIAIKGKNNKLVIADGASLTDFSVQIDSDDNEITIGRLARVTGKIVQKLSDGNVVRIGENTSIGRINIVCGESSSVLIGSDCMLSWGIDVRTTDSHGIFDIETGERLNPGGNVHIGDHVWVGAQSNFTKGSSVANGSVVGIGSLVTKRFDEPNVIVAGAPAKIIRRGVRWDRKLLG